MHARAGATMDPKAELVASARSGGHGASLYSQRNHKPPIAPLMPTQGPKSIPGATQRPPSDVKYLRGALSEKRKLGG